MKFQLNTKCKVSVYAMPGISREMPTSKELKQIIEGVVLRVFQIKETAIFSRTRIRDIAVPRQCYMALMRDFANRPDKDSQPIELEKLGFKLYEQVIDEELKRDKGYSLGKIGEIFGCNHSTVINAHRVIREQWWIDNYFGYGRKVQEAYAQVKKLIILSYKKEEVSNEI